MASFSVLCTKSSALAFLVSPHQQQSSKISFQSSWKSRKSTFLAGSSSLYYPEFLRLQGPMHNQSSIWKVHAQLNEVASKNSSNSTPVPQEKSEISSSGKKDEPAEEPSVENAGSDASSISSFMTQVADIVKDIMELQLKKLDCELIIRKKEALPQAQAATPVVMMQSHSPQAMLPSQPLHAPTPAASASPSLSAPAPPSPDKSTKSSHPPLKCPMAGTFYRSPAPGEPPFVKVGDKIQKGQIVCIIEAMKLMNEIEADKSGTIVEILAEDGKPVSVDVPLFVIEP